MSYTHLGTTTHKAAKKHQCTWCGQAIEAGETYRYQRGVYCGDFQANRWHPECEKAGNEYFRESGEDEFTPWENERPTK